ncbi:MAG: tRNA epoxyqueuosine(34) reductase QueG [Gemmatimonadota bacterium]|nr:tRNA epoxyqueuosine(34) reductase QueG [Gemmatimonadota bacterium]
MPERGHVRLTGTVAEGRELRETIRREAHACGFDQVGFAPAEPPEHAGAYRSWLDRGRHGEMGYMAREDAVRRRLDPREALPGCRTLIVVSLVYGPEPAWRSEPPEPSRPTRPAGDRRLPVIARYAVGRDYHDVFEERLDELAGRLKVHAPGAVTKRYVDYGPVLERDHAQRAGLGWIGKNTMLIDPRLGSYLMLGELLTDLELPPDDPFVPDRCGSCERCIVACPTDAIVAERELDARRCISYLTIELRGPIPEELRPALGTRVFGCDICQEVCPWNAGVPRPERPPFALQPGRPAPPATMRAWAGELLDLDDDGFRERYRGTAFARPGREGLLRNLAVGLGNAGDPSAGAVLERMLSSSPLVAEHAAWALERLSAGPSRPEDR